MSRGLGLTLPAFRGEGRGPFRRRGGGAVGPGLRRGKPRTVGRSGGEISWWNLPSRHRTAATPGQLQLPDRVVVGRTRVHADAGQQRRQFQAAAAGAHARRSCETDRRQQRSPRMRFLPDPARPVQRAGITEPCPGYCSCADLCAASAIRRRSRQAERSGTRSRRSASRRSACSDATRSGVSFSGCSSASTCSYRPPKRAQ